MSHRCDNGSSCPKERIEDEPAARHQRESNGRQYGREPDAEGGDQNHAKPDAV